jgi:plastocyanin
MPSRRSTFIILLAMSLLACAAPGTSTPPTGASRIASSAPPSASSAATEPPTPTPSPEPSVPEGAILVVAENVRFDPSQFDAPADKPFQIAFRNLDGGTLHNIEIKDAAGASLFKGDAFTGDAQESYDVPALAAGLYPFLCTVHPEMTGTLTAE